MGRANGAGVGGSFKREGTHIFLGLIHVVVGQKPIQHYEAIILQLNIKRKKKKEWDRILGQR